jgi:hypothetical protein
VLSALEDRCSSEKVDVKPEPVDAEVEPHEVSSGKHSKMPSVLDVYHCPVKDEPTDVPHTVTETSCDPNYRQW